MSHASTAASLNQSTGRSALWQALTFVLLAVPILLIVLALVPLNFSFVPHRVTGAWYQHVRVDIALYGVALLGAELIIYALLH